MSSLQVQPTILSAVVPASSATFTIEHYDHMIKAGMFDGKYEKNVELLWGKIVDMPPIGPPHETCTDRLNIWSVMSTRDLPILPRVRNSIRLRGSSSAPQPDICWVREKDYSVDAPQSEDVVLVIEVADSSLPRDRGEKLAAYAQAGIPEYWIVNVIERQIEVYRDPDGLLYRNRQIFGASESIAPLAYPQATLNAAEIFV